MKDEVLKQNYLIYLTLILYPSSLELIPSIL